MRVISFDVGIKNLAFCIFDVSNDNISIINWDVLNLIEETSNIDYKCNCKIIAKKRGEPEKICGNKAKYHKENDLFCEKHAKANSTKFIIPTKECSQNVIKKKKIEDLHNIIKKYNIPINNAKLKTDLLNIINDFFEKKCIKPIIQKRVNAGEVDLITIGKNLKNVLNNLNFIDTIDIVLIENQISPIANRMKTIQGMLAQYFIMKNSDINIDFISSSNKLKAFTSNKNEETNYAKNKKDGIIHCSQILQKNNCFTSYKDILNNHKKSDDLADCFLQGIWYLQKNKFILMENYIICGQLKNK